MCPGSFAAPLRTPQPGILQGMPPKPALYCVGSTGKIACYDRTLRPASLGGDIHRPERPSAVKALPMPRYCGYTPWYVAFGETHL